MTCLAIILWIMQKEYLLPPVRYSVNDGTLKDRTSVPTWSFSSPDAGPAEADPELTADPPDEFPEVEEPARLKCGIEFGGDISDREATEDDPVEEVGMTAG